MKSAVDYILSKAGLKVLKLSSLQALTAAEARSREELARERQQSAEARQTITNLQAQLVAVQASLPSPLQAYVPPYAWPLLPKQFTEVIKLYDSQEDQENISRHVMNRTLLDPAFAELILSRVSNTQFRSHVLYRQMAGAYYFATGRLSEARDEFVVSIRTHRNAFNYYCLARVELAQDNGGNAETILKKGLALYPRDRLLSMELSTYLYRNGRIDEANQVAEMVLDEFRAEHAAIEPLQREIEHAMEANLLEKPIEQDIYTDEFSHDVWLSYFRAYTSGLSEYQDPNVALDAGIRRETVQLLQKEIPDATTFIDFGAFCGYTMGKLAEQFPRIKFIGIDRPKIAKSLNDKAFPLSNIEFIAGDVLELFSSDREFGSRPILFHSRTAVFCYPAYLTAVYRRARVRGIRDVIMQEGSTFFSRWWLKYYPSGQYPSVSVAGRGSTFLHDYKQLLKREGFKIRISADIRPKQLLDDFSGFGADHRVIHFQTE